MKRLFVPGILSVFLFLPAKSQAQPLDVPYQIYFATTAANSIVVSTANFPSPSASVNANVASYQWCIDHAVVTAPSASTFTMAWSTGTLSAPTTDYAVVTAANVPYDAQWPYRDPYCAPVGQPILKINSTVAGSSITVQGYLWKGWNP